jgi:hypothetical protein
MDGSDDAAQVMNNLVAQLINGTPKATPTQIESLIHEVIDNAGLTRYGALDTEPRAEIRSVLRLFYGNDAI